jgi:hypothetical protein
MQVEFLDNHRFLAQSHFVSSHLILKFSFEIPLIIHFASFVVKPFYSMITTTDMLTETITTKYWG